MCLQTGSFQLPLKRTFAEQELLILFYFLPFSKSQQYNTKTTGELRYKATFSWSVFHSAMLLAEMQRISKGFIFETHPLLILCYVVHMLMAAAMNGTYLWLDVMERFWPWTRSLLSPM